MHQINNLDDTCEIKCRIIKDSIEDDNLKNITVYGIEASDSLDESNTCIVSNISADISLVESIINKILINKVSLVHVRDIIIDTLFEIYSS